MRQVGVESLSYGIKKRMRCLVGGIIVVLFLGSMHSFDAYGSAGSSERKCALNKQPFMIMASPEVGTKADFTENTVAEGMKDTKGHTMENIMEDTMEDTMENTMEDTMKDTMKDTMEDAMGQLDFSDIEQFIRGQQSVGSLSFKEVMERLMAGDLAGLCKRILESLKDVLFSEVATGGRLMGQILALGILGAVFTNFSSVFSGSQISETGFFVTYLLLFTLLTAGLGQSISVAADTVSQILQFMKVLMPAYFLAVALAGGSVSAVAMYEFTLLMITVGQWVLGSVMIPAVRMYMLFVFASNMMKEEFLSRLTELLEQLISWGMKTLLGVVLGFHLIQGLVLPYVDSLKNGSVQKLIGMIPGIGQGASAVTQMLLGSGVLIKNTMGMAAVVILMVMVAVPVMKLAILMVLYQCMAALMEPICDKRLVACISAAAKGHKLLLKIVTTAALLLVITVALVCAGTNVTYYA